MAGAKESNNELVEFANFAGEFLRITNSSLSANEKKRNVVRIYELGSEAADMFSIILKEKRLPRIKPTNFEFDLVKCNHKEETFEYSKGWGDIIGEICAIGYPSKKLLVGKSDEEIGKVSCLDTKNFKMVVVLGFDCGSDNINLGLYEEFEQEMNKKGLDFENEEDENKISKLAEKNVVMMEPHDWERFAFFYLFLVFCDLLFLFFFTIQTATNQID